MSRIIAITNQKGGVGKTTTAINLAASLAAMKRRVLLIDMDPQGNATMGSGVNKHEAASTTCDVLLGTQRLAEIIQRELPCGYDVAPGNGDLTMAEVKLRDMAHKERRLRAAIEDLYGDYDYIFIDSPPALNMLTLNAMVAADGVLVPMQCEYYALEGLSDLVQTLDGIREDTNPWLQLDGVVRTMFDPRNNLAVDVSAQLTEHFGEKLFNTVIPRNVRLAEAPSHGLPVLLYDKTSRGAQAYLALAAEFIRREQGIYVARSPASNEALLVPDVTLGQAASEPVASSAETLADIPAAAGPPSLASILRVRSTS